MLRACVCVDVVVGEGESWVCVCMYYTVLLHCNSYVLVRRTCGGEGRGRTTGGRGGWVRCVVAGECEGERG